MDQLTELQNKLHSLKFSHNTKVNESAEYRHSAARAINEEQIKVLEEQIAQQKKTRLLNG